MSSTWDWTLKSIAYTTIVMLLSAAAIVSPLQWKICFIIGLVAFVYFIRHNPKKRYMNAAYTVLGLWGALATPAAFELVVGGVAASYGKVEWYVHLLFFVAFLVCCDLDFSARESSTSKSAEPIPSFRAFAMRYGAGILAMFLVGFIGFAATRYIWPTASTDVFQDKIDDYRQQQFSEIGSLLVPAPQGEKRELQLRLFSALLQNKPVQVRAANTTDVIDELVELEHFDKVVAGLRDYSGPDRLSVDQWIQKFEDSEISISLDGKLYRRSARWWLIFGGVKGGLKNSTETLSRYSSAEQLLQDLEGQAFRILLVSQPKSRFLTQYKISDGFLKRAYDCLLYTSPSPRDQRGSRMPSSA